MSCKVSKFDICHLKIETWKPYEIVFPLDVNISTDKFTYRVYRENSLRLDREITAEENKVIISDPALGVGKYSHELIWNNNGFIYIVFRGQLEITNKTDFGCSTCTDDSKNIIIDASEKCVNVSVGIIGHTEGDGTSFDGVKTDSTNKSVALSGNGLQGSELSADVKIDNDTLKKRADGTLYSTATGGGITEVATGTSGNVKWQGKGIINDELEGNVSNATTSVAGVVRPDGTSITIVDGVISAVGGGGGSFAGVEIDNTNKSVTLSGKGINADKLTADVKIDGTTIVKSANGTLSAVGGSGGGAPTGIIENGNPLAVSGGEVYNQFLERNLFTLELGTVTSTGNGTSLIRGRTIDFIDISTKEYIYIESNSLRLYQVFFYDVNKTFLSSITITANDFKRYKFVKPANTVFCKIVVSRVTSSENLTEDDFKNYFLFTLNATKINLSSLPPLAPFGAMERVINTGILEMGTYGPTGTPIVNNIRVRSKDFINVKQGFEYSVVDVKEGFILANIYRCKDGVIIDRLNPQKVLVDSTFNQLKFAFSKVVNTEVITVPEMDSLTFRLSNNDYVKSTEVAKAVYQVDYLDKEIKAVNPFLGKSMISIGDSITEGYIPRNDPNFGQGSLNSYAKIASDLLGLNFNNQGISGSTLARMTVGDSVTNNPMIDRIDNLPIADYVTLMGGTNDIRKNKNLGVITDRVSNTYYGALHIAAEKLLNKYLYNADPKFRTKIVFITPTKCQPSSVNGVDIKAYRDAMIEVANYYNIKVFDAYNLSGLTPELFKTLQGTAEGYTDMYNPLIPDGIHPNQKGQEMFGNFFAGFLRGL